MAVTVKLVTVRARMDTSGRRVNTGVQKDGLEETVGRFASARTEQL